MPVMHMDMDTSDELRMEWDPFGEGGDTFYPGAGRAELVDQLLHLLRYGPALSLLAGPAGAGKRTVLVRMLQQLDRDLFDLAVLEARPELTFDGLLAQLNDPWRSLQPFTLDNYLETVPAVAAAADEESKTLVCVLVGAQVLAPEVVGHLQALLGASAGLPVKCLLLVDAPELEAVPVLAPLLQALPDTAVQYVEPLDEAQSRAYLEYRLQAAGIGQMPFDESQVRQIAETSGGFIVRINQCARDLLLDTEPAVSPAPAAKRDPLPWMHIGALGAVVLVLLLLWANSGDKPAETAEDIHRVVLDSPVQPMTEPATDQTPFAEVARVAAEAAGPAQPADVVEPEVVAPAAVSTAIETPVAVLSPTPAPTETVTAPAPAPAVTSSVPAGPAKPAPVEPTPAKPAPAKPAPAPTPARASVDDARTAWLRSLPADHYVLQLLGAQEEATVKRFLSQYPSLRKVTYYKTWRQGKPWYVVVQGNYPSYEAAKAAVSQLPPGLRAQNPWVRKVEAVVREIPKS